MVSASTEWARPNPIRDPVSLPPRFHRRGTGNANHIRHHLHNGFVMITLIGLVVLIAAIVVGVAAVVANTGDAHRLPGDFVVFNQHYIGSTGILFLCGIILGAIGMFGLILLLTGAWGTSHRNMSARREIKQSRREMAAIRKDLAAGAPTTERRSVRSWTQFLRGRGQRPLAESSSGATPQATSK
jgi:uncharacterized membrane protein